MLYKEHCVALTNSFIMSKSNPYALNGYTISGEGEALLQDYPHPDTPTNAVGMYHQSMKMHSQARDGTNDTGSSSVSNDYHTPTGSVSVYSWGMDEAELDQAATECVRRKFDRIDAALFEGRSTGTARVDEECREWSSKFPHLEVRGIHLLDSMEDGTEMVAPDPFLSLTTSPTGEDPKPQESSTKLMIQGTSMRTVPLQDIDESSPLYEEVIAIDGNLEEYFAFDNSSDEVHVGDSHRHSRLKRHHGLPPVTPNACMREAVMSLAFNHLWSEVISVLQPLISAITENSQGHDSAYSLVDNTLTPTESPLGEGNHPEEPYLLRGLKDPPTLTTALGQSGSKFLRLKYATPSQSGMTSTLPQLTNLSGVMQIRSLSLQQRAHSSYVPNVLPISDNSRECTPTPTASERPESLAAGLRFSKLEANSLPRNADYQIPPTPGPPGLVNNRLISSRMGNRRNINTATLKPLEKPKTPALVPIDSGGIRGFKLRGSTTTTHSNSPPSTPFIRHTQLPPLEGTMGSGGGGGGVAGGLVLERSPTTQIRMSAQQKNRVTFSSRIASAADTADLWPLSRAAAGGGETRPSTTSTSYRHNMADSQKSSAGRKAAENFGRMKVVGYAAGFHGNSAGGGGGDLRDKVSAVIAEDEEMLEDEQTAPATFTVTGKSGIFQSKPRSVSSRTKSRGHVR